MFISNSSSQSSGPVIPPPVTGPSYQVPSSLRLRNAASANLSRTVGAVKSRTTFTDSFWLKRGLLGAAGVGELLAYYQGNINSQTDFLFTADDKLAIQDYAGFVAFNLTTTQVFRDASAWYHIVFVLDTTHATASERVRLYINGVRVTSFSTETYPSQNYSSQSWQSGTVMTFGSKGSLSYFDGYLADVYHIDGLALDPSYFGQVDPTWGTWTAKAYAATNIPAFTEFAQRSAPDADYANVSLLVHGRGTNGSTAIFDSSLQSRTLSVNGGLQLSTTQAKYSGASLRFTGSVDYLYAAPDASLDFAAGNFTLEGWFWIDSTDVSGATMFATRSTSAPSGIFVQYFAGTVYLYLGDGTSWVVSATAPAGSLDAWHHYAIVRSGTTVYIFVDGVVGSTTTSVTLSLPTGQGMTIGIDPGNPTNNNESFKGFMSDLRITKGVARYVAAFTPPLTELPDTSPITDVSYDSVTLLAHFNGVNGSTSFKDASPIERTLTANGASQLTTTERRFGSSSFALGGSTDNHLSTSASTDFGLGNNAAFTIEFQIYLTAYNPSLGYVLGAGNTFVINGTNGIHWLFVVDGSAIFMQSYNGAGGLNSDGVAISLNAWHHVAFSYDGTNLRVLLDGALSGTFARTIEQPSVDPILFVGSVPGMSSNSVNMASGYLDELRITKGVARYVAAFTPPTIEFPNVGPATPVDSHYKGVTLLAHFNGVNGSTTFKDSSSYGRSLTVVGSAAISTSQSRFGGGSLYLNGTDSRVVSPHSVGAELGSVDFTIECYYYFLVGKTAAAGYNVLLAQDMLSESTQRGWIVLQDGDAGGTIGFAGRVGTTTYTLYSLSAPSINAWHHIAIVREGDLLRLFCDGELQGTLAITGAINAGTGQLSVGNVDVSPGASLGSYINGYIDEVRITKGVARYSAQFYPDGWSSYGAGGHYLPFSNATNTTTLGQDASPQGNNWTLNNVSLTAGANYDAMYDVPLGAGGSAGNGLGNYAVLNPAAAVLNASGSAVLTNGNLNVLSPASNGIASGYLSSLRMSSGKWYSEFTVQALDSSNNVDGGITLATTNSAVWQVTNNYIGVYTNGASTAIVKNSSVVQTALGAWAIGDVCGIAVDLDGLTISYYKNGVQVGTTVTGITPGTYVFWGYAGTDGSGTRSQASYNFGQQPFAFTPPTGYKALHTGNLATPAIAKPASYFDIATYTGNGGSRSVVTAEAFQPNLVWIKSRSATTDYKLIDSVRGATFAVSSNTTGAQATDAAGLQSFNADGFTLSTDVNYNNSGAVYLAWSWKKGATPGVDIVTYTGNGTAQNVGHALGATPGIVMVKGLSAATPWVIKHSALAASEYLKFSTDTPVSDASVFSGVSSSQLSLGSNTQANDAGQTYVAYLFTPIPGFSAMGSYVGNGSVDGVFVNLGFRPRFFLVKGVSASASWFVFDTTRDPLNPAQTWLAVDNIINEVVTLFGDFTADGVKLRSTNSSFNGSGNTFIYMAFAEAPTQYSLAR